MSEGERTREVEAWLAAMPGASGDRRTAPRSAKPQAVLYKVMDKMFAILSLGRQEYVILKSDPHLAEILREQFAGVGHRSHLDRRFWISVSLDADVPMDEVQRLAQASYDQVVAGLTKKQRAELGRE